MKHIFVQPVRHCYRTVVVATMKHQNAEAGELLRCPSDSAC